MVNNNQFRNRVGRVAVAASLLGACLVRGAPVASGPCQVLYRGLNQVAVSRLFHHDHTERQQKPELRKAVLLPRGKAIHALLFAGQLLVVLFGGS